MAAKVGITIKVQTAPSNSFWDDVYLKQPFVTSYWYTRHPVSSLSLGYRKNAKYNETHWYHDDFDHLLDEAATAIDPAKAAALYRKAQQELIDQGGAIVPVFASLVAAVRKGCSGYVPHIESRVIFQNIVCK
jgi:peptide/nickel transport system substrate-binding protein